jgi:hypothetical protein
LLSTPTPSAAANAPTPGIRVEIDLFWADAGGSAIPAAIEPASSELGRVRDVLGLRSLRPLSAVGLSAGEGDEVQRNLGRGYRVAFRVGRADLAGRLTLHGFELRRLGRPLAAPLLRADLRPWVNRPLFLGLARSETAHQALLVRVICFAEGGTAPGAGAR